MFGSKTSTTVGEQGVSVGDSRSLWRRDLAALLGGALIKTTFLGVLSAGHVVDVQAETTFAPRVNQRLLVNTNRRLQPDPPEGTVYGESTDLRLGVEMAQERWSLQATPRVLVTRYTSEQDYDTEEYFLTSAFARQWERTSFNSTFDVSRTATISSELFQGVNQARPLNQDNVETGFNVAHALNERLTLSANYFYNLTSFEDAPEIQQFFVDYRYHTGGATLSYQFSPNTQWFTTLSYAFFKTVDATPQDSRNRTWTGFAGISHAFDDTLDASLAAGQNVGTVALDGVPGEVSAGGLFLNFNFEKRFEKSTFSGAYSEQVQPSSLGGQRNSNVAEANYQYRFDERWRANVNFRREQDEAQADVQLAPGFVLPGIQFLQRRVMNLNSNIAYRIDKEWQILGQYQFRRVTRDATQTNPNAFKATGHLVGIAINWGAEPTLANEFWY